MSDSEPNTTPQEPHDPHGAAAPAAPAPPAAAQGSDGEDGTSLPGRWRNVWQAPAALLALAILAAGLLYAVRSNPGPDFRRLLDGAEQQIEAQQYAAALETLNQSIAPFAGDPGFTRGRRQQFHILRARAVYLGQSALGLAEQKNYETVISEYQEAERLEARLPAQDAHFLARSYLALGEYDRARARARTLPDDLREQRNTLLRMMVEQKLDAREVDSPGTLDIIGEFLMDPALTIDDRAWAEAQQARLLARLGEHGEVVHRLLRAMPRMSRASPELRGELALRLGSAYLQLGALDDAASNLAIAERLLTGFSGNLAEAVVLLGRIDELRGEPERARERYQSVYDRFGASEAGMSALLGLAEVEATLGGDERAAELYLELVGAVLEAEGNGLMAERVGASLLDRSRERAAAGRPAEALRYAQIAEQLHGLEVAPVELLQALGDAHRLSARERLAGLEPDHRGLHDLAGLDVATRDQARRHFRAAGAYYRILAGEVEGDDERFGEAIWISADSYDRAGDHVEASRAFDEFIGGFDAHPRRAEARFRLALARQALGAYDVAAAIFRGLIEDSRDRVLGKGVGPYAEMSYVPLAQCYILDGAAENDEEALDLLARVARGEVVRRESQDYLTALIEYGGLLYQREQFTEAIETLSEAQERLAGDRRIDGVRFRLGDAYRLEAQAMARTLQDAMPDADRRALEAAREARLERAIDLFEAVRSSLEGRGGGRGGRDARLTGLEELYLRNAYLYLGACAFDLGRFDEAVRHYGVAQERYPKDPASLAPMIQIVHAHMRRGEVRKAEAANARALRFYQSIPEEAWDDPTLPMTNREWERWHQLTSQLIDGVGGMATATVEEEGG